MWNTTYYFQIQAHISAGGGLRRMQFWTDWNCKQVLVGVFGKNCGRSYFVLRSDKILCFLYFQHHFRPLSQRKPKRSGKGVLGNNWAHRASYQFIWWLLISCVGWVGVWWVWPGHTNKTPAVGDVYSIPPLLTRRRGGGKGRANYCKVIF